MQVKIIRTMLLFVLVLPLVAACGGVDVARIISVEETDPTEMPMGDSGVEIIPLTQSIAVIDGISISYPTGWAAQTTEFDGTTLANNQAALDAFNSDDLPDYNVIGEGNVVMVIQVVPVMDSTDAPGFLYELLRASAEDDGEFAIGEATEVTIGEKDGLLAPLTILDEAIGVGLTDVYILQINAEFLALALVIAPGDEIPTTTAEAILASLGDGEAAMAAEVTEEPDDMMQATATLAPPTEVVEEQAQATATFAPPTATVEQQATATLSPPTPIAVSPTATVTAMEPMEDIELSETLVDDGFTFNYPAGWVAESDIELGTIEFASNQATLDTINALEETDFSALEPGSIFINMSFIPGASMLGTPADIFDLLFAEIPPDEAFNAGEAEDVMVGAYAGIQAELIFAEDVPGEGLGEIYILDVGGDQVLLVLYFAQGTEPQSAVVEAIIASLTTTSAENAP